MPRRPVVHQGLPHTLISRTIIELYSVSTQLQGISPAMFRRRAVARVCSRPPRGCSLSSGHRPCARASHSRSVQSPDKRPLLCLLLLWQFMTQSQRDPMLTSIAPATCPLASLSSPTWKARHRKALIFCYDGWERLMCLPKEWMIKVLIWAGRGCWTFPREWTRTGWKYASGSWQEWDTKKTVTAEEEAPSIKYILLRGLGEVNVAAQELEDHANKWRRKSILPLRKKLVAMKIQVITILSFKLLGFNTVCILFQFPIIWQTHTIWIVVLDVWQMKIKIIYSLSVRKFNHN